MQEGKKGEYAFKEVGAALEEVVEEHGVGLDLDLEWTPYRQIVEVRVSPASAVDCSSPKM